MGGLNELEAVAVRQWGLITRAQAVAVGLSPVALRWRVQTGALERVHSDVFRFRGAPLCWRQQALALALQCGPGSAVSHQSAAFLYDLWGISDKNRTPPRPIDVTTSRSRNPGHLEGVRLHRSRGDFTVEMRSGVPVTSVARTLVDLCDVLSEENLAMALDSARKGHPLIAPQLHALAATLTGRPGMGTLMRLLGQRESPLDSGLEIRLERALAQYDLPRPVAGYSVFENRRYLMKVDFAWKDQRVALHADSYDFHRQRQHFERDARQRSLLTGAGWHSLVVTSKAVNESWWVEALRHALSPSSRA